MSDREYVVDVIKHWLREGEEKSERDIRQNFVYLNMLITDTQAFLFRDGNNVILVFRGSQQLADWEDESQNSPEGVHHSGGIKKRCPRRGGCIGVFAMPGRV